MFHDDVLCCLIFYILYITKQKSQTCIFHLFKNWEKLKQKMHDTKQILTIWEAT